MQPSRITIEPKGYDVSNEEDEIRKKAEEMAEDAMKYDEESKEKLHDPESGNTWSHMTEEERKEIYTKFFQDSLKKNEEAKKKGDDGRGR